MAPATICDAIAFQKSRIHILPALLSSRVEMLQPTLDAVSRSTIPNFDAVLAMINNYKQRRTGISVLARSRIHAVRPR